MSVRREYAEAEAPCSESCIMATVQLKNIKKVYPFVSGETKKKKKKDAPAEEKKVACQEMPDE